MLLNWIDINPESGNLDSKSNPNYNVNNISQFASNGCKQCYGRGYAEYSLGKDYKHDMLSMRTIACDCVLNHFAKLNRLEESLEDIRKVTEDFRSIYEDVDYQSYMVKNKYGRMEPNGQYYLTVKNAPKGVLFYKGYEVKYEG